MSLGRFVKHALFAFLSLFITGIILFAGVLIYFEAQLPDVNNLHDVNWELPLKIYTSDNKLIGEFGSERRTPITIQEVPKPLIEAILATEDQRFFEHSGIDPFGIGRAFIELITTGRKVQGGSTITMQVARNYFLSSEKTYSRKIREILLAIKIDQTYPKDKILELYLNKIYFGNHAYGVASAAQVYYGKSLNQLTLPEMAMLAGLPKAPSQLNPLADPDAAKDRRDHVLERMYELGYINKITYDAAVETPLMAKYHSSMMDQSAPYAAEMVRDAIYAHFGDNAYKAGYTVYTTLDSKLQSAADAALKKAVFAYDKRHGIISANKQVEGALIALNPQTGAVLALDGGVDYGESSYNRVTQAHRQPGSTFKPFIYAAALAKGYTLASLVDGSPISMYDPSTGSNWTPQNDDLKIYGPTRLKEALAKSMNLAAIHMLQNIGLDYAVNYTTRFGFDPKQLPHNLTMALGTAAVTPLQMASAYAIFANGGYKVTPYMIDRIVDADGKIIYQAQPKYACERCIAANSSNGNLPMISPDQLAPQVITPQVAYLMTSAMKEVITDGTGRAAESLNRSDLAGKTGSMDADAWFSGFNSDIVATAWLGFDDNRDIIEYGNQAALPMWMSFMKAALQDKPLHTLPQPPGIVTARIDPQTGQFLPSGVPGGLVEWFDQNHMSGPASTFSASPATSANSANSAPAPSTYSNQGAPVVDGTAAGKAVGPGYPSSGKASPNNNDDTTPLF